MRRGLPSEEPASRFDDSILARSLGSANPPTVWNDPLRLEWLPKRPLWFTLQGRRAAGGLTMIWQVRGHGRHAAGVRCPALSGIWLVLAELLQHGAAIGVLQSSGARLGAGVARAVRLFCRHRRRMPGRASAHAQGCCTLAAYGELGERHGSVRLLCRLLSVG